MAHVLSSNIVSLHSFVKKTCRILPSVEEYNELGVNAKKFQLVVYYNT